MPSGFTLRSFVMRRVTRGCWRRHKGPSRALIQVKIEGRLFFSQIPCAVEERVAYRETRTATRQYAGIIQIASQQKHVKVSDYVPSIPSLCVGE